MVIYSSCCSLCTAADGERLQLHSWADLASSVCCARRVLKGESACFRARHTLRELLGANKTQIGLFWSWRSPPGFHLASTLACTSSRSEVSKWPQRTLVLRFSIFNKCIFLSEKYVMQKVWPTSTKKPLKISPTSNTCEYGVLQNIYNMTGIKKIRKAWHKSYDLFYKQANLFEFMQWYRTSLDKCQRCGYSRRHVMNLAGE